MFDHLHTSEHPLTAQEVAAELGINEDGAERLLSACVGLELLIAQSDENGRGMPTFLQIET